MCLSNVHENAQSKHRSDYQESAVRMLYIENKRNSKVMQG